MGWHQTLHQRPASGIIRGHGNLPTRNEQRPICKPNAPALHHKPNRRHNPQLGVSQARRIPCRICTLLQDPHSRRHDQAPNPHRDAKWPDNSRHTSVSKPLSTCIFGSASDTNSWDWFATSSTPSPEIYKTIADIISTAPEVAQLSALTAGTLVLGVQPISSALVQAGVERGGNVLGLDNVNQTWFVLDVGWWKQEDDAVAHNATRSLIEKIERVTKAAGSHVRYVFMNDASWDQPVIDRYGKNNVRLMRQVRQEFDPRHAFHDLASGGFKLSL
jgi:hypothetical protein